MEEKKEELSDKVKKEKKENPRYFKFNPSGLSKALREEYSFFIITSDKSKVPHFKEKKSKISFLRKKKWEEIKEPDKKEPDEKPLRLKSFRALRKYLRKRLPNEWYIINETDIPGGTIYTFEETTTNKEGESPRFRTRFVHLLIKPKLYYLEKSK